MTTPKTAHKSHRGIHSRIENTQRLIAEFRTREMTRKDIMALFDFCESGAGKYIRDLLDNNIIEISRITESGPKTPGRPVFWLTASEEKIAAYFVATSVVTGNAVKVNRIKASKSGLLHVMSDDAAFKVKMHRKPVAPDPFALPVSFFAPRAAEVSA